MLIGLPGQHVDAFGFELVSLSLPAGASERLPPPRDLDVDETGLLDLRDVLSLQESAANSGSPNRDVVPSRGRDVPVHDDVSDLQPTASLEHPESLP